MLAPLFTRFRGALGIIGKIATTASLAASLLLGRAGLSLLTSVAAFAALLAGFRSPLRIVCEVPGTAALFIRHRSSPF
jgi:hypothetical protein